MKIFKFVTYILFFSIVFVFGCRKNDIAPENYFEIKINNINKNFVVYETTIDKGITIIAAHETNDNSKKSIIITINADDIGSYKQTFDYKTGVSISQCGLTYKIISKEIETSPSFFMSYEGEVEITEIDRKNCHISGSYDFKLYSVPDNNQPYNISGKFIRTSYN
ncbi:MAG: hypothetical protein K8R54_08120 [Bacteroidales bacterium]|nr:hypothetical protein [Bacteroidales bacterium]